MFLCDEKGWWSNGWKDSNVSSLIEHNSQENTLKGPSIIFIEHATTGMFHIVTFKVTKFILGCIRIDYLNYLREGLV